MVSTSLQKKYLISGIGPGSSGVGRLMNVLVPEYSAKGYQVIFGRTPQPLRPLIKGKHYLYFVLEIFARSYDKSLFYFRCLRIFCSEIVFLHPQTAGYPLLFFLTCFNKVHLYVMDNSFFCISSYNTHPLAQSECLECVGQVQPHKLCFPFPSKVPKIINILYLKCLRLMSSRLRFLAQNYLQKELLCLHFGRDISVSVIGMNAVRTSLPDESLKTVKARRTSFAGYDVVFHGASTAAKGLFYVLEIAKLNLDLRFLIPDSRSNISRIIKDCPPNNVSCIAMSWETGLQEEISKARLVINPSLWSAPIEGALVKSALYNRNVATVQSQYAYEAEISSIVNHLRLPRDPVAASKILREFLASNK